MRARKGCLTEGGGALQQAGDCDFREELGAKRGPSLRRRTRASVWPGRSPCCLRPRSPCLRVPEPRPMLYGLSNISGITCTLLVRAACMAVTFVIGGSAHYCATIQALRGQARPAVHAVATHASLRAHRGDGGGPASNACLATTRTAGLACPLRA